VPGEVARGGLVGDRALAAEQERRAGLAPVAGGEAGRHDVLRDARVHAVALAADLEGGPVRAGLRLLKVVNSQPYGPDVVDSSGT
jgi:hypothetical protein